MKTDAWGSLQVCWVTNESPEWYGRDKKRISCKLTGDGAWHTYRLPLGQHPAWKGTVTHLRIDPTEGHPGQPTEVHASIDYLRLLPGGETNCFLAGPLAEKGRGFPLLLRVFNGAAEPLTGAVAELASTVNGRRVDGDPVQTIPTVAPGRGAFVQWQLVADEVGAAAALVEVRRLNGKPLVVRRKFLVSERCDVARKARRIAA